MPTARKKSEPVKPQSGESGPPTPGGPSVEIYKATSDWKDLSRFAYRVIATGGSLAELRKAKENALQIEQELYEELEARRVSRRDQASLDKAAARSRKLSGE